VWRRDEPPLDRDTVDGIIRKLMEIDQKLNRILEELNIDDEEEEDA
jgi:uncharacterized protein YxjI